MPLAKQSFRVTSQRGRSNMPHTISASQQWRYQRSEHCHFRAGMGPKMNWMNHINTPLKSQKVSHITGIYQSQYPRKWAGWITSPWKGTMPGYLWKPSEAKTFNKTVRAPQTFRSLHRRVHQWMHLGHCWQCHSNWNIWHLGKPLTMLLEMNNVNPGLINPFTAVTIWEGTMKKVSDEMTVPPN